MNLDTLEKLADAATAFCNKCGYIGKSEPNHTRVPRGTELPTECSYQAARLMYCNPATIKALIALCRMQNEALVKDSFGVMGVATQKALAAYERFDKGE